MVHFNSALHETALKDLERSIAARASSCDACHTGELRYTHISTCTAVLLAILLSIKRRMITKNAPKMCFFCIARSSAHSDAPMCQVGVTAGSITRARAGEEATHAEKQRERGTAFSTPFLCLPAAWKRGCLVKRRRQVGEDPQGRPSRQAVSGSGKRGTPAVVLPGGAVGSEIAKGEKDGVDGGVTGRWTDSCEFGWRDLRHIGRVPRKESVL